MPKHGPFGQIIPWTEHTEADPVADIRGMAEYIKEHSNYQPTVFVMSSRQKYELERYYMWRELMEKMLEDLPWWAIIRRMVYTKQLDGRHRGLLHRWFDRRRIVRKVQRWRDVRRWKREDPEYCE